MILTYEPDGEERQEWQVRLGKLRSMETEAIERVTGLDWGTEYKQRLLQGNMRARRALLWTLLRRQHPKLQFADVDFADDEVVLRMDTEELAEQRGVVEKLDLPDLEKSAALALIDEQMITAPAPPGKAPASNGESGGGSPSPSSPASPRGSKTSSRRTSSTRSAASQNA